MLSGNVTDFIQPILASDTLNSRPKKCGRVRPIAIGDKLRRLNASHPMIHKFEDHFKHVQLGAGARNGCEAAARGACSYVLSSEVDHAFVKNDFSHNFIMIQRGSIFEVVHEQAPENLSFVKVFYEKGSFLFCGHHLSVLVSGEGFQQGDGFATFGFCVVIHKMF